MFALEYGPIFYMVIRANSTEKLISYHHGLIICYHHLPLCKCHHQELTKANHVTWKAQVLAILRDTHLVGHVRGVIKAPPQEIDGKVNDKLVKLPNPAYDEWYASEQQVLGFLLTTHYLKFFLMFPPKRW
jgi:hypothetical protein